MGRNTSFVVRPKSAGFDAPRYSVSKFKSTAEPQHCRDKRMNHDANHEKGRIPRPEQRRRQGPLDMYEKRGTRK